MRLLCILMLIVSVWFPTTVCAEFYKYKDQNGVLRFTDNIADVPEDQRIGLETHQEVISNETPADFSEMTRQEVEERQKALGPPAFQEPQDEAGNLSDQELNQKKAALDQEYANLMKEKRALLESKKKIRNVTESKAYNKKVGALNQRIADFDTRRQAFTEEADAFNEKMKSAAGKK